MTVHRIQSKDNPNPGQKRKAVLLQHGILDASSMWIVNDVELAPGFKLAKEGYDVWLGNNRGNTYSRKHKTMKPS